MAQGLRKRQGTDAFDAHSVNGLAPYVSPCGIGPAVALGILFMGEVQAAATSRVANHPAKVRGTRTTATSRARPQKKVVRAQRTATPPAEFRAAIADAHQKLTGREATPGMLDVLTAHVSHETASGDKMYNYNFGGIKGAGPDGYTARYKTSEFYKGKKTKIIDGFRAYETLDDGAKDYLVFLQGRYSKAYAHAEQGDVDGFSRALKQRGYYTAPVNSYSRAMRHHMDNPGAYAGASMESQAGQRGRYLYGAELAVESMDSPTAVSGLPTAVEIARVMDAMSGLAARIGSPSADGDETKDTERW